MVTLMRCSLAKNVDEALVDAAFAKERRPFQPHLTLARLPEQVAPPIRERLAAALASVRTPRPGQHRFRELSLMRSYLERGGARYERVRSTSCLKGKGVAPLRHLASLLVSVHSFYPCRLKQPMSRLRRTTPQSLIT
jgi:hypothetical protein